ncbi:MAG: SIR2 family NAD-dependent protein deacylase [Planctomycetota bacterium]|jgi:NAD-dependent deacetylase
MITVVGNLVMDDPAFAKAVESYRKAEYPICLTGAGISVESGIPDFRSPGGLWSVYDPQEYATIDAFRYTPEKAWKLFRAIAETLRDAKPNPAHAALSLLEAAGRLEALITQNIDNLHQAAGSSRVIEVHGDHGHLQCLNCNTVIPSEDSHWTSSDPPACAQCNLILKPNVVVFGEEIRHMDLIQQHLSRCDAMLVVGTSAQVYPVASMPVIVKSRGGRIFEFNVEETMLTLGGGGFFGIVQELSTEPITDYFFMGKASRTLRAFAEAVIGK